MKVVVVGAGVVGLSCAHALVRSDGIDVTIVEGQHPGSGSTGLSVGNYTRQYLEVDEVHLRVAGAELLFDLEREGKVNVRKIGLLRIARSVESMMQFEESASIQHELGASDTRVLTPVEVARLVPHLDIDGVIGALYCPSDGYVDGTELCTSLAETAQARGATLRGRTSVTGLRPGATTKYIVATSRGDIPADRVVNAAGPWIADVGDLLGAPVRVVNERHEAYVFALPNDLGYTMPIVTQGYTPGTPATERLYFRGEGAHQLIAGLHTDDFLRRGSSDPDGYERAVVERDLPSVVTQLLGALPTLEDITYQGGWAGLYPHSPDGRPFAGPHPNDPDILVGGGLGGAGLVRGLVLGEVIAHTVRFDALPDKPHLSGLALRPSCVPG